MLCAACGTAGHMATAPPLARALPLRTADNTATGTMRGKRVLLLPQTRSTVFRSPRRQGRRAALQALWHKLPGGLA